MITQTLIGIWKRQGVPIEEIERRIKKDGSIPIILEVKRKIKRSRKREKNYTSSISFKIPEYVAKNLELYIYQQTIIRQDHKSYIYRHIFEEFLKSFHKEKGFTWIDKKMMVKINKRTEEQGK